MVTIVGYKEYVNRNDGNVFFVLKLQGGIDFVKSRETGNLYVTAKNATVSSTFDEEVCKSLIGTKIEGEIKKYTCAPYKYTVKETGEEITLQHKWVFEPDNNSPIINEGVVEKSESTISDFINIHPEEAFSMNGVE